MTKNKNLEKTLEEEFKDIRALLNGIDRSTKTCLPEEECEAACIKGLKQGNELLEKLKDEKLKDDLFSELVEAEYDLAGKLVEKEQYNKAIEHFQNLNQIGRDLHGELSKIVRNKESHNEFLRKFKKISKKYPTDTTESKEKFAVELGELERPRTFKRDAEKLIFCTHLSLAYIYAFRRDIQKVVDETIEALRFVNSDVKWPYGGVDIGEFVPFNLRPSYYRKSWFKKIHHFGNNDIEKDAHVVLCGVSKEESDRLLDRLMNHTMIYKQKIESFNSLKTPLEPLDDPFKQKIIFNPPKTYEPFKIDMSKIEKFKFEGNLSKRRYKEDVANRREYCKELMHFVIVDNKFKVNEETLNAAYKIIATDPTDPGSYLFLMALLGQEDKNKEIQEVMDEVVRLISTKASIKDYDSESVNPNYESVLKADRYVSKPESEENAGKQHALSNFFYKYSKDKKRFAKSYGYAKGVDYKFYLVTELLNEDNLSTFDRILPGLKNEEKKKKKLEQAIDILIDIQEIYEKNKEKLNYKLNDYDYTTVLKTKVIERLKDCNFEDLIGFLDKTLEKQEKTFGHCDFHLGNILEREDNKPAVIDFAKSSLATELFDLAYLLEQEQLELNWEQKQDYIKYFLSKKERKISKKIIKDYHYNAFLVNLLGAGSFIKMAESTKDKDLQKKYSMRSWKYLWGAYYTFKRLLEYTIDSEEKRIIKFANSAFLNYLNYKESLENKE